MTPLSPKRLVNVGLALIVLAGAGCAQLQPLSTEEALRRLNVASTKLYASDGSLIANLHGEINRDIIPLRDIPTDVQNAVIAIEDERFWTHRGVDLKSITRAFVSNLREQARSEGRLQGGSTISQQLVKNLYFPKPERTVKRKVSEARVTFQFEQQYPKPKILEMYLNTIYFGRGLYGIQTAARSYFNKPASELTLGEAAYLAGLIHEPGRYVWSDKDPPAERERVLQAAMARRGLVLNKMVELGFTSREKADAASRGKLAIFPQGEEVWKYPYFVDMVLRQLGVLQCRPRSLDGRYAFLGTSCTERSQNVYRGGLRIYTTLDPKAQAGAEEAIDKVLPDRLEKLYGALVAVEPRTGYIRAVAGGKDYYPDGCPSTPPDDVDSLPLPCRFAKVNLALGRDGGGLGRQPGSSFKPFVLAAALERGVSLNRYFDSSPFRHGDWTVNNYEGSGGGSMNLVEGTVHSVNAVYARLEIEGVGDGNAIKGAGRVAALARRLGIEFPTREELKASCGVDYGKRDACIPADETRSIALGAKEVSPMWMAAAYAVFANEGLRVEPTAIVRIADASGRTIFEADPVRERILPRGIALGVSNVLQQVIQRGTGVRARLGRPAAGKTGTAQEWRDAWFAGYVPQLASAVWVGNPARQEKMTPQYGYPFKVVGGSFPAMIWQYFMTKALAGVPVEQFPAPPAAFFVPQATPATLALLPDVLGLPRDQAVAALTGAGFKVQEATCLARGVADGTVVEQTPAGGVELPQGTSVKICVSVRETPFVLVPSPGPGFGRGATEATVPNVVGLSRARAQGELSSAGFDEIDAVRECDPGGGSEAARVWRQSPAGGSRTSTDSTVTIWYNPASCD